MHFSYCYILDVNVCLHIFAYMDMYDVRGPIFSFFDRCK